MTHVLLITIDLTLDSRGGVLEPVLDPGAEGASSARPLLDHHGRATLPASTLAGSLRAHAADVGQWSEAEVSRWFGVGGDKATPSLVRWCGTLPVDGHDTEQTGSPRPTTAIERSTAIDRRRGAAQNRSLRTLEVIEKGSCFRVYLRVDEDAAGDAAPVLELLATYQPHVGAGVSAGRGATTASRLRWGRLDLDRSDDLRRWVTLSGPDLFDAVAVAEKEIDPDRSPTDLSMTFALASALHVSSGDVPRSGARARRTVLRHGNDLVIPGRTLKGVFRSRAEFILRSLGQPACSGAGGRGCVAECPPCLTCRIFGAGGNDHPRRSAVRFDDAVITDADKSATVAERTHVAIDRFTGGAQDRLLFTDEVVERGSFEVRVTQIADGDVWELARALLLLVACDIDQGYVGIGSAVTRGYGWVTWCDRKGAADDLAAARECLFDHLTGDDSAKGAS